MPHDPARSETEFVDLVDASRLLGAGVANLVSEQLAKNDTVSENDLLAAFSNGMIGVIVLAKKHSVEDLDTIGHALDAFHTAYTERREAVDTRGFDVPTDWGDDSKAECGYPEDC